MRLPRRPLFARWFLHLPSQKSSLLICLCSVGYGQPGNQGRSYQDGGYYGNRNSMNRPDSFIDQYGNPTQQYPGQGRGLRSNPRNNSDPMLYGANRLQNGYPPHGYQQSYDTMASGSAGYQTEPYGNSTDPSSENSSIDRIQPVPKQAEQQQMADNYGLGGFGPNQQYQLGEHGQNQYGRNGNGQGGPPGVRAYEAAQEARPVPPPKGPAAPRPLVQFGNSNGSPLQKETSKESGGKRKSWLQRRFSKK
jgi:hypothetical protein